LLPTIRDISNNPKNLRIKEVDAGVIGRANSDLDAAIINTEWAIKVGIKIPQERFSRKGSGYPYPSFTAANEKDANGSWVHELVESYQQTNLEKVILDVYHRATLSVSNKISSWVDVIATRTSGFSLAPCLNLN